MADDPYKQAFESAVAELTGLQSQRDELQKQIDVLDERMEKVRQGALGLAALVDVGFDEIQQDYPRLFSETFDPKVGITEAVRLVLREQVHAVLTPVEIRDHALKISPAIAGHKNPMASVHAVLRRLVDANEVLMADYVHGSTVFGWIGATTDQAEIKRRLNRWFVNGEEIWARESYRWKDRPEGSEAPQERPTIDAAIKKALGVSIRRRASKRRKKSEK